MTSPVGHQPQPVANSIYTVFGLQTEIDRAWDYPIEGVCAICGMSIRIVEFMGEWEHFVREYTR